MSQQFTNHLHEHIIIEQYCGCKCLSGYMMGEFLFMPTISTISFK